MSHNECQVLLRPLHLCRMSIQKLVVVISMDLPKSARQMEEKRPSFTGVSSSKPMDTVKIMSLSMVAGN
jgi:hypothetical protein